MSKRKKERETYTEIYCRAIDAGLPPHVALYLALALRKFDKKDAIEIFNRILLFLVADYFEYIAKNN